MEREVAEAGVGAKAAEAPPQRRRGLEAQMGAEARVGLRLPHHSCPERLIPLRETSLNWSFAWLMGNLKICAIFAFNDSLYETFCFFVQGS